jgi:acyl-CoA thioesterase
VALPAFVSATAVEALGDGRFRCDVSPDWNAPAGPNGGYVAAIVVRAMADAVAAPERAPRSLTCHFLRPPQPGPADVLVEVIRQGRTLTSCSARLVQGDRVCVVALGAFSLAFQAPLGFRAAMPEGVPAPETVDPWPLVDGLPPIARRFEFRPAVGAPPFSGADEALSGGWMRLREPAPLDAALVAALSDAWLPASFPALTAPAALPTVDLTVHFRAALPLADQPVLGVFRSTHVEDGLVEEDGTLWTADGRLLAQARQLALFR